MIEVLIVEGEDPMSKAISEVIDSDPDMHVVGVARDGFEAIRKIMDYAPDVVLLNLNIQGVDGIEVIKELEKINPVPVVLISELDDTHSAKLTDSWFEHTVVEFILRPEYSEQVFSIREEIRGKVRSASESHLRKILPEKRLEMKKTSTQDKIIILAASTGGPPAVTFVLSSLPAEIPCPIVVVQHMPKKFSEIFAQRLDSVCAVKVKVAEKGEKLQNGVAYVAPGDYHLELTTYDNDVLVQLTKKQKELGVRPCANITMRTASLIYKDATIGVVLTGMGHDGTNGAKIIKRHYGTVIIESKKTCVVYGMPGSIFKSGYYDLILNLNDIPGALIQMLEL